ncbi:cyclic beta-1,2-glucan ABC transporter [Rhodoplanes elegans]|uniref:Cyclic beta-1,2-glucan ABC transporter n=1 Tax=Rhodoplanes elegans TaxID=29408 RepID=A0A327KC67_9BRAD|nr:glucan ABC transporter ATP-binding protein/ permease [Rhodoplanes elegans]MBK5962276.1 cyclic beta-1,2-glucan ABC transporter [Rhodoplanes elegans]RAI35684.1 cyclic beta-1,2-glucan ABC transporter [Rhodoplanes elegans]
MSVFRLYLRALALLAPVKRLAWTLALANLALAAAQFAEPVLFGRVVDTLSKAAAPGAGFSWSTLTGLLAAWAAFGLFSIVCGTLTALYADRLAHQQRQAVLADYFERVLEQPLAFHGSTHSGRLMKVMLQGTDALWGLWLAFFRDNLAAFVSFFVLLPLALVLNWRLALLLVVLCVVFAVLTAFVMRKTETLQRLVESNYSELAERASDTLGNVALVHSFARVDAEVTGLKTVIDRLLAAQIPVLSWWAVVAVLTRASTTLTMLAIVLLGTWLNIHGLASVGEIVTFMGFATMLIARLQDAVWFVNRVFAEAPRLAEFFEVFDAEPAIRDRAGAVDPGRLEGLVEFDDVSFSYDGKRPAVADLTVTAKPGETIAFVGTTGAGKTTALALLHRAFDPQSGTIRIDGVDIKTMKLAGLRRNIGVVFQEGLMFNRSIAENLRIGKPDATEAELRLAAERAQAMEFIARTPEGFDARVGERGRSLSGGERQRLSIARALLKEPPILILDEPTSALDARTETRLMAALDEVMKGRTTFVIAHRLATVRRADRILMFEHGRVIEQGTFDELMAKGGRFAELARDQFIAAGPGTAAQGDAAAAASGLPG